MLTIGELWQSTDHIAWDKALDRYWDFVQPGNLSLEQELEGLDLDNLRSLDPQSWYSFLHDKYFRWKYTAPNRYGSTTKNLKKYLAEPCGLAELSQIKHELIQLDPRNVERGLCLARNIKGLGTAGASGLLALMYPSSFATVDQFVVKALREVSGLQEASEITKMKPESLNVQNAVVLIAIMKCKASENNSLFRTNTWTPRKIDKILWTYGR